MKLPFATTNEGKIREAKQVLAPYGIQVIPLPLNLTEPDAGSIREVAREKLRQAEASGHTRVMVDDAGVFFAAYDGFPGVLTKRVFERIGYRGVMKLLHGETREAWFEGAVGLLWDGDTTVFSARTRGRILEEMPPGVKPEPGFPFNPLFVPDGDCRTLAEMSPAEREKYSYRGKALKQLARWLLERAERKGV